MDWCEAVGLSEEDCLVQTPVIVEDVCESASGAYYRLPTHNEFLALLGNCIDDGEFYMCDSCAESTNCTDMFGYDDGSYWSSSPDDTDADRAWYSSFNGYVLGDEKIGDRDVRCVH
jgi:hypothetical protein